MVPVVSGFMRLMVLQLLSRSMNAAIFYFKKKKNHDKHDCFSKADSGLNKVSYCVCLIFVPSQISPSCNFRFTNKLLIEISFMTAESIGETSQSILLLSLFLLQLQQTPLLLLLTQKQ